MSKKNLSRAFEDHLIEGLHKQLPGWPWERVHDMVMDWAHDFPRPAHMPQSAVWDALDREWERMLEATARDEDA